MTMTASETLHKISEYLDSAEFNADSRDELLRILAECDTAAGCQRCKGKASICIQCDKSLDECLCPDNGTRNPGSCPVCQNPPKKQPEPDNQEDESYRLRARDRMLALGEIGDRLRSEREGYTEVHKREQFTNDDGVERPDFLAVARQCGSYVGFVATQRIRHPRSQRFGSDYRPVAANGGAGRPRVRFRVLS
jgi:hypothetical protein